MIRDQVVEEVRKVREEQLAKFNYDVGALCADARKRQKDSGHPVVSFAKPPKPGK